MSLGWVFVRVGYTSKAPTGALVFILIQICKLWVGAAKDNYYCTNNLCEKIAKNCMNCYRKVL